MNRGERNVIISALYDARHRYTRDRRLGRLTDDGAKRLAEIESAIDDLEREEVAEMHSRDVQRWAFWLKNGDA